MDARPFDIFHVILLCLSLISSRRPKGANLAQAGTNTYETIGNRPVEGMEARFKPISNKRVA